MIRVMFTILAGIYLMTAGAQVDKTKLSLAISKKYKQNIAELSKYTWKRKVKDFIQGKPAMSSLSSVTIGADYKLKAIVIPQQSYVEKKSGIRETIQKSTMCDVNEYVKNAIELTIKYIYLSDGQMVDLFNKGALSLLNHNLQAEGFNLLTQGEQINYRFDQTNLFYINQDIATVMNGGPAKAKVNYETFNGFNRVSFINLDLPGVSVNIKLSNFEYAIKL